MCRAMPPTSTLIPPFRRWAVTGGTGLVGNNVVRALVAAGAEVRVLSRRPPRREFAGLPVEEVPGDLDDIAALSRLFAGVDVVVHAAAMVEVRLGGRAEMSEFLIQFFGGPQTYSERKGHPRLRARHMRFPITTDARDAWLSNALGALDEVVSTHQLDERAHDEIHRYLVATSQFMINTDA